MNNLNVLDLTIEEREFFENIQNSIRIMKYEMCIVDFYKLSNRYINITIMNEKGDTEVINLMIPDNLFNNIEDDIYEIEGVEF